MHIHLAAIFVGKVAKPTLEVFAVGDGLTTLSFGQQLV